MYLKLILLVQCLNFLLIIHSNYISTVNQGGPQKNNFGMINLFKSSNGSYRINDNDNNNNINLPEFNFFQNGTNNTISWSLIIINTNNN